ncbi:LytTR family DNA-binding domain-containing protein [Maribellus maritimus]|uniref:LytTR family DNA-binding domain-containing protein n=1 Tax=Maribellus maritimus TaxID=2870838 RepID=UPI001EE9F920|nr:LytTR family DNA-binding domain-containing protein [Maribellus maritimus]MCG6188103.1 LytTR family transcriptional regulator DNA-binding domain-containing protein [Maribellus maritimus]
MKKQLKAGVIIGLFVFLILWIFQPFGTYEYTIAFKALFLLGYGLISAFSYILFFSAGFFFFKKWFSEDKWNISKEIITFVTVFCFLGFLSLLYHHQFTGSRKISFSEYIYFMKFVFLVGIFPFAVLYYQKWLTLKLALSKDDRTPTEENVEYITFYSNNKKESPVTLPEQAVLFLKAEGNYVEIVSILNKHQQKYLIRNTLNQISEDLPDNFSKVHRSYVVNKQRAKNLLIEGSSYKLQFDLDDIKIPVSRAAVKKIKIWLQL